MEPDTSTNRRDSGAHNASRKSAARPKRDEVFRLYREMLRIRRFEEMAARAYTQGKISGFLHLYIGQEAIAVAAADLMKPGDRVVTTYRDHGFAIALGSDPSACMAELFGKKTGLVGGIGGRCTSSTAPAGFGGATRSWGATYRSPRGTRSRPSTPATGRSRCASWVRARCTSGPRTKGMHLAGLWKLPVVFVIENNQYAMGTPLSASAPLGR